MRQDEDGEAKLKEQSCRGKGCVSSEDQQNTLVLA